MSEQRIEALLATIDAHLAEIFRLKAERDELRAALQFILSEIETYGYEASLTDIKERARAVLKP